MNKLIHVIANKVDYYNTSTFKEGKEWNKTLCVYKGNICISIKRTSMQSKQITLLNMLKRYSCKYVGVSFLGKKFLLTWLNRYLLRYKKGMLQILVSFN